MKYPIFRDSNMPQFGILLNLLLPSSSQDCNANPLFQASIPCYRHDRVWRTDIMHHLLIGIIVLVFVEETIFCCDKNMSTIHLMTSLGASLPYSVTSRICWACCLDQREEWKKDILMSFKRPEWPIRLNKRLHFEWCLVFGNKPK